MTTDRTKMPPDELMGKVVAKWKGWDLTEHKDEHGIIRKGNMYVVAGDDEDDVPSIICMRAWPAYPDGWGDDVHESQSDPRTDTDAALELLHHIEVPLDPNMSEKHWWTPKNLTTTEVSESEYRAREYIPVSGEPFRRAVCWLAVDVMEVSDD